MKLVGRFAIFSLVAASLLLGGAVRAQTASTERVSIATNGTQGDADSSPYATPSISADGRYVAFDSAATNLVPGDTNGFIDIFVRDRVTGVTERVSVSTAGAQANASCYWPSISGDGRFVAYHSYATNLVAPGTTSSDVLLRDRQLGTTERVSMSTAGVPGNAFSNEASISTDGRYVAFLSSATNLVLGITIVGYPDIYVRDRLLGTTEYVTLDWSSSITPGNGTSNVPSISGDGRWLGFYSLATNLVPGDTNGHNDVFIRDRQTVTTYLVSVDSSGAQANADSWYMSLSSDGRFIAFESQATNLVAGDTNASRDIFLRDRLNSTTTLLSVDSAGVQGNGDSRQPSISADGRFVAFYSLASNLVVGDTNGVFDLFVRDRVNGTTERVSLRTGALEANLASMRPAISADGQFVAFCSDASNLVSGDTNGFRDTFEHHRGSHVGINYCTAGTTSNGCAAIVAASANPSLSLANACAITATNAEGQRFGILFYGIDNTSFAPSIWGMGGTSYLCVKHPTQRTPVQISGGTLGACDGSFVLDWNAYQSAHPFALGNPWSAGDRVYAQAWFRDPVAVKATNLSNALELTYVP